MDWSDLTPEQQAGMPERVRVQHQAQDFDLSHLASKPESNPRPADGWANRGMGWQAEIDASLGLYQDQGRISSWFACHPEIKITRHLGKGKIEGFIKERGPPDFVAAVRLGPVLLMDAKDCQDDRFPFASIKGHQADRFGEWHSDNGRCAAVLLRLQGRRFVVPWPRIEESYALWWGFKESGRRAPNGTASLTLDEVRELGLPFDESGWLGPLMRWWGE